MASSKVLEIVLQAKDEASKTIANATETIKNKVDDMQPAFQKMAAAGTVAFGVIAGIGISSLKAFADAQQQTEITNQSLSNSLDNLTKNELAKLKKATGDTKDGFAGLANAAIAAGNAAVKLGFDDETAARSFAKLFGVTKDVTAANSELALAQDLARFKGISLEDATQKLIMVHSGATKELKALGLAVQDNATAEQNLDAIHRQVTGSAETFANTAAGAMERIKVQTDNLKESIGAALEPAFTQLVTAVTPLLEKFTDWAEKNPQLLSQIIMVAGAIAGLVAVVGFLGMALPAVIAGFTLLTGPVGIVIGIIGLLILTVTNVVKIFQLFQTSSKEIWEGIKITIKEAIDAILDFFQPLFDIIDRVKNALSSIGSAVKSGISAVGNAISGKRAAGGPVITGNSYLVGERGPEIFTPSANGSIIPNGQIGGGGGISLTINMNGGTYLDPGVAEDIGDLFFQSFKQVVKFYCMSTTLTIAGVDKASLVDWKSVKREQVLTKEPDTLSFLIRKFNSQTYKPSAGDEVVFTVGATKEFGGYITEINETIIARLEYIECIAKDYTYTLDRQLVAKTYTSQTVDDIIADLLSTFATGFTDTNVNCPITIDKVQFNYLPISKCLEKLTELVGDYEWYVDYDKDIHFFASSAQAATFDLTDTSGNYVFNSLNIRQDTHQLRNEIIVRGGMLTSDSNRTELLSGDANALIFPLATKFASLPTVTVGGVGKTVGVENLQDPTAYDVMWNYTEKSLKFASAPAAGTANISVVAPYNYPLILQKRDESSILTYGLFQYIIIDKTIVDLDTAGLRADVELIKNAQPLKTATFETYTAGLRTGQTINIQSTIRSIDQDFKIQVIKSYLRTPDTDTLGHEIDCVTADDLGINDILARLLVKNPSEQIDLSQDEFVVRIRTLNETLSISDSISTPTKTSPPYLIGSTAIMGFSTIG